MHDLEPFYAWRDYYVAAEDERSPFYGREYNEFQYSQAIYNYYIHPQWDDFGSQTLYLKVLYVDYNEGSAIIELIGEWNDLLHNDIMLLKRDLCDCMIKEGISKFILVGENILNFHVDDDSYYQEWLEDIEEREGWIVGINFTEHVLTEMRSANLHHYIHIGNRFSDLEWRKLPPDQLTEHIESLLFKAIG